MAMVALVVEAFSRKKGKVNRPSELETILLGYYIKFKVRNQESLVHFGIDGCDTMSR